MLCPYQEPAGFVAASLLRGRKADPSSRKCIRDGESRVALNDGSLGSDFRTPVESIGLPKPEMTTSYLGGSAKVTPADTSRFRDCCGSPYC